MERSHPSTYLKHPMKIPMDHLCFSMVFVGLSSTPKATGMRKLHVEVLHESTAFVRVSCLPLGHRRRDLKSEEAQFLRVLEVVFFFFFKWFLFGVWCGCGHGKANGNKLLENNKPEVIDDIPDSIVKHT